LQDSLQIAQRLDRRLLPVQKLHGPRRNPDPFDGVFPLGFRSHDFQQLLAQGLLGGFPAYAASAGKQSRQFAALKEGLCAGLR
jgi:hypothetical protein